MALPERGLALLSDRDTAGFLGVSLLVGTAVGLGAAVLVWVSAAVVRVFEGLGDASSLGAWFPVVSVPLGILAAWWLAQRFAPEVAGDGVPEASAAIGVHSGHMSTKSIPLKIAATALTLGGGGSAGREGPIVQIGGAIGSSISRHLGLGEERVKSLVAAGAAAGIGASFNAPIAGMLFALEVILGSFSVTHMSAVVVSSIAAAVTFRSLVGEEQLLQAGSYSVGDPRELILYAGLAILAVIAAYGFLRLLDVVERTHEDRRGPAWLRPVGLGLVIALIGVYEPRVLGTGQKFVTDLLTVQSYSERFGVSAFAASALLVLVVGKILATSLTLGTGGSGGAFMPSLFIGAAL
ncbi:MAG: chloride channel protein, partial [Acidimicrobiia bacterium]|nr:chloride channel protein [Acidimicrobiia bacterium]